VSVFELNNLDVGDGKMPGTNIMVSGTGTGGVQSAVAQIDVPLAGNLTGVTWNLVGTLNATEEFTAAQISFGSAFTVANDSRQIVSQVIVQAGIITAAGAVTEYANLYDQVELGVSMGERLYMHLNATAGVITGCQAILHFDFDLDRPSSRRR
jgi:hypothetical protein